MSTLPQIPRDVDDIPANVLWVPNVGWIPMQGVTVNTDSNNNQSAALVISGGGGGGSTTQYTDGQAPPSNPIGMALVFDNSGSWLDVGADHPLPITGSITATNPSVSTDGSAIPLSSTLIGGSDGTNLQPLQVDASKYLKVNVAAGTGALETGGHLASIDTHTPALGSATMTGATPITIASNDTNFAELLLDTDNLATIQTNTSTSATQNTTTATNTANIPAKGTATMTGSMPVTVATNDTVFAELLLDTDNLANIPAKGSAAIVASTPVNIASDQVVPTNITKIAGNAIASGSNAMPTLNSASSGYVAAYGSNPANTGTASTDASFKWGAGGTTQVNHIWVQNNSGVDCLIELDTATGSGSPHLSSTTGANNLFLDVQTTVLHVQSGNASVPFNAASGILIKGWL